MDIIKSFKYSSYIERDCNPASLQDIFRKRCVMATTVVRHIDFGKDMGLIHEVIVTGRKVGAGREFWARLAHDESLFQSIVPLVLNGGDASVLP